MEKTVYSREQYIEAAGHASRMPTLLEPPADIDEITIYNIFAHACTEMAKLGDAEKSIPAWKIEPCQDKFAICVDEFGNPESRQEVTHLRFKYKEAAEIVSAHNQNSFDAYMEGRRAATAWIAPRILDLKAECERLSAALELAAQGESEYFIAQARAARAGNASGEEQ